MEEHVILVDEQDNAIGLMPKMEAHEKAVLHRAFSVFVLNQKGEIMLQQRAADKYHSPMLWTNTCGRQTPATRRNGFLYRAHRCNELHL